MAQNDVTQVITEVLSELDAQQSVSQALIEVVSNPSPQQSVSQALVEVVYVNGVSFELTWDDDNVGVTFNIERSTTGAGTGYSEIASGIAVKTYTESVPEVSGVTYWYRVRAYNGAVYSDYSNIASVTIS